MNHPQIHELSQDSQIVLGNGTKPGQRQFRKLLQLRQTAKLLAIRTSKARQTVNRLCSSSSAQIHHSVSMPSKDRNGRPKNNSGPSSLSPL
ncbi:hypothetical protein [Paenibacillus dendritiformis]|uniref:hypothetical protein n=1 Tax=Paenibacillus dendritiformis TaxID=130049 RepID=UPI00387E0990